MRTDGHRKSTNFEDRGQGRRGRGGLPIQALAGLARVLGFKGVLIVGLLGGGAFLLMPAAVKQQILATLSGGVPGVEGGLQILANVRAKIGVPVLTDVHTEAQATTAGDVVDILQIPAFLCRQTDLIEAAVLTGKIVNVKKGQFLSPAEMGQVVRKTSELGGRKILVTERGTTFGYNNLVSDLRSIPILRRYGFPVVFDATHSVQLPGGGGDKSSGQREFAPLLARCAIVAGADGVFIETHPKPDTAPSDGPNMIPLAAMPKLIAGLARLHRVAREI
jgi:2-dehydro-3-deoxyphosphooctonate aldolase (KDO 8-P synthase)